MTMITTEKLSSVQGSIQKLMAQGESLYADIAETVQDRARLLIEAEQREKTIDELNAEVARLAERNVELEKRNEVLANDAVRLESHLSDATARLTSISATAQFEGAEPREQAGGNGKLPPPNLHTLLQRVSRDQHQ